MKNIVKDDFLINCEKFIGIIPKKEYMFHPKRKWRFDYAFVEHKLAVEIEGGVWTNGRHVRPQGFLEDMKKYNSAVEYRWFLLRFTPQEVLKRETYEQIKRVLFF